MKRVRQVVSSVLIVLVVLTVAAPAMTVPTVQADSAVSTSGVAGAKSFARCVWNTIKLIPAAKKLAPEKYQKLEQALNDASNSLTGVQLTNPYVAATVTGAKIGKFIGFNFVWYVGVVQSCWKYLRQ